MLRRRRPGYGGGRSQRPRIERLAGGFARRAVRQRALRLINAARDRARKTIRRRRADEGQGGQRNAQHHAVKILAGFQRQRAAGILPRGIEGFEINVIVLEKVAFDDLVI